MLPGVSPPSGGSPNLEQISTAAQETASFHEHGTFFALWLLVIFVGVEILTKAGGVLEPILWAFFLMMGLVPLTDVIEKRLNDLLDCWCKCCRKLGEGGSRGRGRHRDGRSSSSSNTSRASRRSSQHSETELSAEQSRGGPTEGESEEQQENGAPLGQQQAAADSLEPSRMGTGQHSHFNYVRTVAVIIVIVATVGLAGLFFMMVYRSAVHMQGNMDHYQNGATKIIARSKRWLKKMPEGMPENLSPENLVNKALEGLQEVLSSVLSGLVSATTHTMVQMLWIGLYMVFWLCQPFHVGREVSTVFRRYIFLKGLASAGYALMVWILLHALGVDLAIVFGLITFVLNFIPEIGPFFAMVLPLPVILFDDRMTQPINFMVLAFAGQMVLKVIFGNIVEIKLIESQQEMRMHPVIILFFVAFFQSIWGATGMLLSVPIVAAMKATLHKIPPSYRRPILVFLEGDHNAPARWEKWRQDLSNDGVYSP